MVSFSRGKQQDKTQPTWYKSSKPPRFSKETDCQRKQRGKMVILLWESQASSKLKLQVNWKVVGDFQYRIRRLLIVLPQTGLQPSLNCGILFCELSPVAPWLLPISHLCYYQRIYVVLWPHPLNDLSCPKGTPADTCFSLRSFWLISSLSHI